jgi:hypothetical protein
MRTCELTRLFSTQTSAATFGTDYLSVCGLFHKWGQEGMLFKFF